MATTSPVTTSTRPAREKIREAAHALFEQQGYTATTIEAIAKEGGVGVSTVYAVFGNKREILADIRRHWFAEADIETLVGEALATDDPYRKLALCARWVRLQMEMGHSVFAMIVEATRADPLAAELFADIRRKPEATIVKLVASMKGALAPDVSTADAAAIIWALASGSVYRELVGRGWSADRFEAWLADALQYELLGGPTRAGRATVD